MPTVQQIMQKFPELVKLESGDSSISIEGINHPNLAEAKDLIFIPDQEHLQLTKHSNSMIWCVHPSLLGQIKAGPQVLLSSKHLTLLMATLGREYFPRNKHKAAFEQKRIHPTAVIAASAKVAETAIVGPHAVIGDNCQIGEHSFIGPQCVLEPDVVIGKNCFLQALVFIGQGCQIGDACEIKPHTTIGTDGFGYAHDAHGVAHRLTHYGRVILKDNVHVGASVQIDRGTFEDSMIGENTKIDNHCHFGHNIKMGKNNIVTGGMITAGSATIGDQCVFGGRTTIGGHLDIASGTQIAGLSGVSKSVDKKGRYGGYPLQPLQDALKTSVSLAQLPRMRKQLNQIMNKLGITSVENNNTNNEINS